MLSPYGDVTIGNLRPCSATMTVRAHIMWQRTRFMQFRQNDCPILIQIITRLINTELCYNNFCICDAFTFWCRFYGHTACFLYFLVSEIHNIIRTDWQAFLIFYISETLMLGEGVFFSIKTGPVWNHFDLTSFHYWTMLVTSLTHINSFFYIVLMFSTCRVQLILLITLTFNDPCEKLWFLLKKHLSSP